MQSRFVNCCLLILIAPAKDGSGISSSPGLVPAQYKLSREEIELEHKIINKDQQLNMKKYMGIPASSIRHHQVILRKVLHNLIDLYFRMGEFAYSNIVRGLLLFLIISS